MTAFLFVIDFQKLDYSELMCHFLWFIWIVVYWTSLACRLIFLIKFGKFSTIISSIFCCCVLFIIIIILLWHCSPFPLGIATLTSDSLILPSSHWGSIRFFLLPHPHLPSPRLCFRWGGFYCLSLYSPTVFSSVFHLLHPSRAFSFLFINFKLCNFCLILLCRVHLSHLFS